MRLRAVLATAAAALAVAVAGCHAGPLTQADSEQLQVVTTTGVIADLVRNVAGDAAAVVPLVPDQADPHSYEPTLRDVRNIVYADVAFSNYLMLEEHNLIKTLDANIDPAAPNIGLAEGAMNYSARIIPLVEDVSLDTVWLGLRVSGAGLELGADRASEVRMRLTGIEGPQGATVHGFLTQALGQHTMYFDSSDGLDENDVATLPANAHTHLSWAFSKPGIYRLSFRSGIALDPNSTEAERKAGEGTFTFAVGVDPRSEPGLKDKRIIDAGHADLTTDLDHTRLLVHADAQSAENTPAGGEAVGESAGEVGAEVSAGENGTAEAAGEGKGTPRGYTQAVAGHDNLDPREVVIEVTNRAWQEIPRNAGFLGPAGESTYLLPQAVLGKHVHGEIDPHLWHDVSNAIAYVKLIRDTLAEADPEHAQTYRDNADKYIDELGALDEEVRTTIGEIPEDRRYLVTTHDAFAYLGAAYDIEIAGFVTPNPATEPKVRDRIRLAETVDNLKVPAVFLEPQLAAKSHTLTELAHTAGIQVCDIYSDAFDSRVTSYGELMRFNAQSLKGCLT